MKSRRTTYFKYFSLFFILIALILITGCGGTTPITAAYGSIDVKSSPDGAEVYLDDVDTGSVTPIVLTNIEVGIHSIKLEKYHYKTKKDINISVNAEETTYLNWSLTYAPTKTITLQPGSEGKDSHVSLKWRENNFGDGQSLVLGYSTFYQDRHRAYLQFELNPSPLSAGAIVTNANLKLYRYSYIGSLDSFTVGLYQVTSDWGEDSITWDNQPTSSNVVKASCTVYSISYGWRTWNIDDSVKGWLDGSISNYGMVLKPLDEVSNYDQVAFRSSDLATNSIDRPKLEIDYYMPYDYIVLPWPQRKKIKYSNSG